MDNPDYTGNMLTQTTEQGQPHPTIYKMTGLLSLCNAPLLKYLFISKLVDLSL